MFGNKKTSPVGDDVQLATRSMKSDLEGTSEDNFIHNQVIVPKKNQEIKPIKSKEEIFPKKETTLEMNRNPLLGEKAPENLPIAKKTPNDFFEEDRLKKQLQEKKDILPADNFFQNDRKFDRDKNPTTVPASPQKNYDDFFKDKIKEPLPEQEKGSPSLILVIILVIVLIIAISSGAYYYFFVLKAEPVTEKTEPVTEFPVAPETEPEIEPIQPPVEETLPTILSKTEEITIITGENIKTKLLDPQNSNNLISGFYSIKDENGVLNLEKISALLEIEIPQTINTSSQEAWLYYEASATPKIGLVINVNPTNSLETEQAILASEQKLPTMLSGLYFSPIENQSPEKIIFKDSVDNIGFRYYNINPNPSSLKSLDWGTVADDKFLVFATSKEMAQEIKKSLSSPEF